MMSFFNPLAFATISPQNPLDFNGFKGFLTKMHCKHKILIAQQPDIQTD